jgi:hypothetical protein
MTNDQFRRCGSALGHRPSADEAASFLAREYGRPLDRSERDSLHYSLAARSHEIIDSHEQFYTNLHDRLGRGARGN